jgi:acetylornithine deacetylase
MKTEIPDFREQLTTLISIPSVSSTDPQKDMSNRPLVEQLASWLEDLGFNIEVLDIEGHPGKANLLAVAGQGSGGLVLSGHTDTVPYDETGWKQDPFRLIENDNKLYGLGTSDMKCFFPIVLDVLRDIDLTSLTRPLYILATSDEESTMSGAKSLLASGRSLGEYALIGEPTGLKPVNMHKGIMFETIQLTGRSGHSSDPALGINALEGMNSVINRLISWRAEIQGQFRNEAFKIPYPTLNIGSIKGGDSPNRICGECDIQLDIRFLPDMRLDELRASLRRTVLESIDGTGLTVDFNAVFPGIPGFTTPVDSDIVKMAEKLAGEPACSVAFGTEGPYLSSAGMQTVILGPGDIDVAHQANEYLELSRINPMKNIISELIKHYCM